ncbi:hypothetical protein [Kiloniella litopenaei]|uniref:hypothetical protein n=1 Tax=Kiloniella litopenaei TaxID=1549748 RepID=UPI003BAA3D3A
MAKGAYDGAGGFDQGGATGPSRNGRGGDKPTQSQIDAYTQAANALNKGGFTLGGNNVNTGQGAESGAREYEQALGDYNNVGNSVIENLANFAAGMFGFNEQAPSIGSGPNAGWGWDPVVGLGSIAGMGFGIPGLGMATDVISGAIGRPAEIGLGSNVFDGVGVAGTGGVSGMGAGGGPAGGGPSYEGGGAAAYGGSNGVDGGFSGSQPAPSQTNGVAPVQPQANTGQQPQVQMPDGMYYRPQGTLDQAPNESPEFGSLLRDYYEAQAWNPSWFTGPFSVPGAQKL